jgi:uncharacterized protein YjbI with pentapeptide repeats
VDLRKADLSGADLSKARFLGVDLREANLSGADLSKSFSPVPIFARRTSPGQTSLKLVLKT